MCVAFCSSYNIRMRNHPFELCCFVWKENCSGLRFPCCVCVSEGCRTTSAACLVCPLAAAGCLESWNISVLHKLHLLHSGFGLSRQVLKTNYWTTAVKDTVESKWLIIVTTALFALLLLWWSNRKNLCLLLRQGICCFKRYVLRV